MYIFKTKLNIRNILQYASHPLAAQYLKTIDENCDSFRGTDIVLPTFTQYRMCDATGERTSFEKAYFQNINRLNAFFLRTALYGEERDLEELQNVMWAICNSFNWPLNAHTPNLFLGADISEHVVDLLSAEIAQMLAEILSVLGDSIDPYLKKIVVERINERVFLPFESGDTAKYRLSWEDVLENWAAVCGGSLGMAALYLIEDEARLEKILARCIRSVNNYIKSCTDDGICLEGLGYWNYAMCFYVAFDALLKERTGKSAVQDAEKYQKLISYPQSVSIGNARIAAFADGTSALQLYSGLMLSLAGDYGVKIPKGGNMNAPTRLIDDVRKLALFDPALLETEEDNENRFFPLAHWAIFHADNAVFAAKGGHNDEPHNHNDIGSFLFDIGKDEVVADLGSHLYDRDYFLNETRYNYINTSSRGHSVPIINDCLQEAGVTFRADGFRSLDNGVEISFAGAYPQKAGVSSLVRSITLCNSAELTVSDTFAFRQEGNTVKERIVTRKSATAKDGKVYLGDDCAFEITPTGSCASVQISTENYLTKAGKTSATLIDFIYETKDTALKCGYQIQKTNHLL